MSDSLLSLLKAGFLGLVEGLTEFIPVSSTAHLLLIGDWIAFSSDDAKVFEVVIQLGSILAVMWIFRARIVQLIAGTLRRERTQVLFARNLALAFLPAAVIGALTISYVKMLFAHPGVFVCTLITGGLIMLWVERKPQYAKESDARGAGTDSEHSKGMALAPDDSVASRHATTRALEDITCRQALIVGFAQCLAMVPGTSRSGATIISGMLAGIQRKTATEFSFFLAMPTMLAATVYDVYKHGGLLSAAQGAAIAVGFVMAFFSALFVVRAVLRFVSRRTYRPFAWYRIGLGLVVLAWLAWR